MPTVDLCLCVCVCVYVCVRVCVRSRQVWDLRQGACVRTEEVRDRVYGLAFDAARVALATANPALHVYDLETWRPRALVRHDRGIKAVCLGGGRAFTGSYDQTVKVWAL